MIKNLFGSILCFTLLIGFTSCEQDDPDISNEEELITEVTLTMTPSSGGEKATFSFKDEDGDGGQQPVITGGTIQSGVTYFAELEFLGLEGAEMVDITEEIIEEGTEHQVFFSTNIEGLSFSYNDTDTEGRPLGINTTFTASTAAEGVLNVILRHEPNKAAEGVSMGQIDNAGGETDIEVSLPITVE